MISRRRFWSLRCNEALRFPLPNAFLELRPQLEESLVLRVRVIPSILPSSLVIYFVLIFKHVLTAPFKAPGIPSEEVGRMSKGRRTI